MSPIRVFNDAAKRPGLTRDFIIVESTEVAIPLITGTFHPVVMLPSGFMEHLINTDLGSVALHELAHVKRNDALIPTLVSVVRAVLFSTSAIVFFQQFHYIFQNICVYYIFEGLL